MIPGRTLVEKVRDSIRTQISGGVYKPGDRLPSEAQLTKTFNVSRTVIREAVAALRSDRLVEPRQGAGVFVQDPPPDAALPFGRIDPDRVSSMIEMLELRTAVESDAAGFAALRRSPAQEEVIVEAFQDFRDLALAGKPTSDADVAFHHAIADGTNNPRFSAFLRLIGPSMIPRRAVVPGDDPQLSPEYSRLLIDEHDAIVAAIQGGDEAAARQAMRQHLTNSQIRYRRYLREQRR